MEGRTMKTYTVTYNVTLVHADDGFEQMRPHCSLITEPVFNLL